MKIVDAWMQHPTLEFLHQPEFASLRRWMGDSMPSKEIPPQATVASMDAGGVGFGLLSAWWGPRGPILGNDFVHGIVERFPDRFAGVAAVDLETPMASVRELRRCVQELGFKALRIVQWLWRLPPTDRLYYPLFAECVHLGVPVCLQVGHTGPLRPSETGRPIPYIDQVAIDFPELTLVCGHIGYPWTQEMIAVATKHENVYIDTSAYTPERYPPELVSFLKAHGRRKVLFGTNYPMIPHARCATGLSGLGLTDDGAELFLSANARRVFALDGES